MQGVLGNEEIPISHLCCQALLSLPSWVPEPGGRHLQLAQSKAGRAQENALLKRSQPTSCPSESPPQI